MPVGKAEVQILTTSLKHSNTFLIDPKLDGYSQFAPYIYQQIKQNTDNTYHTKCIYIIKYIHLKFKIILIL